MKRKTIEVSTTKQNKTKQNRQTKELSKYYWSIQFTDYCRSLWSSWMYGFSLFSLIFLSISSLVVYKSSTFKRNWQNLHSLLICLEWSKTHFQLCTGQRYVLPCLEPLTACLCLCCHMPARKTVWGDDIYESRSLKPYLMWNAVTNWDIPSAWLRDEGR